MMDTKEAAAFMEKQARYHVSKDLVPYIGEHPKMKEWFDGSQKKPNTRYNYAQAVMKFFNKLGTTPEQFLKSLETNYRTTKIRAKGVLIQFKDTPAAANIIVNGLRDFTKYHEIDPPFTLDRFPAKRKRKKKRETWETANKIIDETPQPYREVYRFLLHSALDENDFALINCNHKDVRDLNGGDVHQSIEKQRKNEQTYIRLDLPPRKGANDIYFVLTPKLYVPKFPLTTIRYKNRGGELVSPQRLRTIWRRACKCVLKENWYPGFGPHTLRSVFRSTCGELGIPIVAEWQMGRGGDIYGYDRSGFDEDFIINGPKDDKENRAGGLGRLWGASPIVDRQTVTGELRARDQEIGQLRSEVAQLREDQKLLDIMLKATTGYGVIKGTDTQTGKPSGVGIYLADRKKLEGLGKAARPARKKHRPAT
jgi:hypothetical protein